MTVVHQPSPLSHQPSAISHDDGRDRDGFLTWWTEADSRARHAFIAAALGWMLDSFDVMLYAMVLRGAHQRSDPAPVVSDQRPARLRHAARRRRRRRGVRVIADRLGRKRALMGAILIYSVFTAACGFVADGDAAGGVPRPARPRHGRRVGDRRGARLGVVSGATSRQGARLRAELVGDRLRPRRAGEPARDADLGLARRVLRRRASRRSSRCGFAATSRSRRSGATRRRRIAAASACCSRRAIARVTVFVTLMNACTLFGWWGLNSWVPAYLALGPERGGIGLSSSAMSLFVIADAGRACGSATSASATSPTRSAAREPT